MGSPGQAQPSLFVRVVSWLLQTFGVILAVLSLIAVTAPLWQDAASPTRSLFMVIPLIGGIALYRVGKRLR